MAIYHQNSLNNNLALSQMDQECQALRVLNKEREPNLDVSWLSDRIRKA